MSAFRSPLMLRKVLGLALVSTLLAWAAPAHAALLGLQQLSPDINTSFMSLNYQGGTFNAIGTPSLIGINGEDLDIFSGSFALHANIDSAGHASSASLSISGEVDGGPNGVLLTSSELLNFGYSSAANSGHFEFLFKTNGAGSLLGTEYGGLFGVLIHSINGGIPASTFNSGDWTGTPNAATSDTFSTVPEPASMTIWGALILGAAGLARRRNRQS